MNKRLNKLLLITILCATSTGCSTMPINNNIKTIKINENHFNQDQVTEQEIINQKLKTIPEEDQIDVTEDKMIPSKNIKQKIIEVYIPNYEEDYLIAKTISLDVEEGSRGEYVDTDKVLDFLREKEIIPQELPNIYVGKQFSGETSCLNVDFPEEVYSLFNNKDDEKLFLDATLKTLLNIYDTDEVSISVNYQTYRSNFIEITEIKYYR